MKTDPFHLARFTEAQETSYASALAELRSGRKKTHWIWFVFPQLRGLGTSFNAERYGLTGLTEAQAYLEHPVLGHRLREATEAMLAHQAKGARAVLGDIDALKLCSCLTLFSLADPSEKIFRVALDGFFNGECDRRTLTLLERKGEG